MPTFNLAEHEAMHAEWIMWQKVVHEFRAMSIDLNEERWNPLARSLELWGDELALLRSVQAPEVLDSALEDKRSAYERAATPGFTEPGS
jgi:hypothetical protein